MTAVNPEAVSKHLDDLLSPLPQSHKDLQKHLKNLGFVLHSSHKNSFCYTYPHGELNKWVFKSMPKLYKRYKNAQRLKYWIDKLGIERQFSVADDFLVFQHSKPILLIAKKVMLVSQKNWDFSAEFMLPFLINLKRLLIATKLSDLSSSNAGFTPDGKWTFLDTGNTDPRPIVDFFHQLKQHHLPAMKKQQQQRFITYLKQSFPQAKGWD